MSITAECKAELIKEHARGDARATYFRLWRRRRLRRDEDSKAQAQPEPHGPFGGIIAEGRRSEYRGVQRTLDQIIGRVDCDETRDNARHL